MQKLGRGYPGYRELPRVPDALSFEAAPPLQRFLICGDMCLCQLQPAELWPGYSASWHSCQETILDTRGSSTE